MPRGKFYKDGLRFTCTECGQCCSNPDGFVEATFEEAAALAELLELSASEFMNEHVEMSTDKGIYLRSFPNGDCIFLKENRCTVYEARPVQCRTYPFWSENIKSAYRWKRTADHCPGIHDEARLWSREEIEERLKLMKK